MSTAITTTDNSYRLALEPADLIGVMQVANMAAKIQLCGVKTPEEAAMRIMFGREHGFSAMQALRLIHVINGRPCIDAAAIVGLCLQSPECEYFECVESTREKATYRTKRRNREERVLTWTIEQARQAKLAEKDNWKSWPENMLRARCSTNLARMVFPEVTAGMYEPEELRDASAIVTTAESVTTTTATPSAEPASFASLASKIEGAASPADLDAVAKEIAAAKKAGHINTDERTKLATAYTAKKATLGTGSKPGSKPDIAKTTAPAASTDAEAAAQ